MGAGAGLATMGAGVTLGFENADNENDDRIDLITFGWLIFGLRLALLLLLQQLFLLLLLFEKKCFFFLLLLQEHLLVGGHKPLWSDSRCWCWCWWGRRGS